METLHLLRRDSVDQSGDQTTLIYNSANETSTGHSPSTMTAHDLPEWFDERGEGVASSAGPTKRHKLLDGSYDAPELRDTATPRKSLYVLRLEDDAQLVVQWP
ncbi:hypothetical protein HAX54_008021 [Datura stramonium]|uniref:Uncharacterized protein n=1 Tax=Datura stramonium TaxID=4076 RepID=A0ABS8TF75_DATST|nr:hypothetical protein [Datura stramonium]